MSEPQDPRIRTKAAVMQHLQRQADATSLDDGARLKGKVGIITGAGHPKGIGYATARLMARQGANHLYLLDYIMDNLPSLAKDLQNAFPKTKVTHVQGDAGSSKVISELVNRVMKEEGHLDFFFANAGVISPPNPEAESRSAFQGMKQAVRDWHVSDRDFMEVMRINTLSVYLAVKYASPAMAKLCPSKGKHIPGGSIILTASVAGLKANAGPIPYSASKAAVVSIAQTSASALTGQNIRVNAICPGLIDTDMPKGIFLLAEAKGVSHEIGKYNPLLRAGIASEIAPVAAFLASDDSSYINGQAIPIDGGLSSSLPFVPPKL
ncbi:hypothetical protein BD324DRAFT_611268 [Kockovaella imperatae]|uniref:2,4-dienoyl-CoA reductase n=1 Tax=Kockovaella imperatae TaxID=4999 RepID=A0A1Y1USE5_9TREE|nr:hypothetical protein BD324DRAFT_611268 [Kockovaella imperatae]ORX40557.1 hypothetical protein BD324DRAFT_611268 [Kockovaella imperatae]